MINVGVIETRKKAAPKASMIQEMFSKQNNKCAFGSAPMAEPSLQKLLPCPQQGNCTLAAQSQYF